MKAPVPVDEPQRVAALRETAILDTPPETEFDDIAVLASEICGTPIALVSLVDSDRQWFKARIGLDLPQTSRDAAMCAYPVADRGMLEVGDAAGDARFADSPLVAEEGVRFYAGAPLLMQDGHAVGTVCVMDREPRELTGDQRRALRALARHAAAHLELRRYARRVVAAADRLRELDRLKDSFLASVSHELRTPLSLIRGYLEVLLDDDADPDTARRFLAVMQRNADRLLRLIDDLLLVARLHEDGLELSSTSADLSELVYQVTVASRPLAEHKGITVVEHTGAPIPISGDPQRLSQAFSHLMFNAIKFTPEGGRIAVATSGDEEPTLTIMDTGVGIPRADLPYLFDRFHRSSTSDLLATQGSGVGLTIVKAIIDAHGGTIAIESEPDEGTTVCVTLPRHPVAPCG
ncbi:GAF domain-containing sensor histidine kinase [Catenuloplanes atrovinosus]|uniref:histidine kinase n=1 Tax=Catenuloplanes atrovinosus TaxID=137266 RepID=A0AAE3YL64_9ACTN|nr:ATP-binding protein [Catenuloplanes atrovinosus]MDR7274465.1 signal transduction histidine kinase [Catenuloplanes atrovinosus]